MEKHLRRMGCVAALGVAALGLVACSSDKAASTSPSTATTGANQQTVSVKLFQFQPQTINVSAGTEVVWENGDDTKHEPTSGAPGAIQPTFDVTIDGVGCHRVVHVRHSRYLRLLLPAPHLHDRHGRRFVIARTAISRT